MVAPTMRANLPIILAGATMRTLIEHNLSGAIDHSLNSRDNPSASTAIEASLPTVLADDFFEESACALVSLPFSGGDESGRDLESLSGAAGVDSSADGKRSLGNDDTGSGARKGEL